MEVAEVLPDFADAFAFEEFNRMQREALPALLERDDNVVASAPTASGKTALAELAICKTLEAGGTALFIAPMRALTNEKESDWDRFEELGHSVYVVTGERDLNPRRARRADILVMTPEKLDSATRKHDSHRYDFVTGVDVCVIDEVHLLDADRRGSVLEVTVSRLRRLCDPRIVALSATMPNVADVAAWLDAPPGCTFEFGDEYRPVDLNTGIKTYTHGDNPFEDKYRRLYRSMDILDPHITPNQVAISVNSEKQSEDLASVAGDAPEEFARRGIPLSIPQHRGSNKPNNPKSYPQKVEGIGDERLKELAKKGIGVYHSSLSYREQNIVEDLYKSGEITTLFYTESFSGISEEHKYNLPLHWRSENAERYNEWYDYISAELKGGQGLVFVSSRQDTVQATKAALNRANEDLLRMGLRGNYDFHQETQKIENDKLREYILDGAAFHHAGLSKNDKDLIEKWFRDGKIQLLFSTSTLAWGVNLPARCVVIRDTKLHDPLEGEVDMSPLDVLQMLGRAGRPGYDDVGYGWVVCDAAEADKYRRLLRDGKEIESRLAANLDAHLNAEIAMGTIEDLEDVMEWLETTFYYVRGQSRPEEYDFPNLRERVRDELEGLVERGFVETGADLSIEATPRGVLASKYYLRLDTAAAFAELCERENLTERDLLRAVAEAEEFDSVSARQAERDAIDAVLVGDRGAGLEPGQRKVLAILQGAANGAVPSELRSDAWVIRQNATRLLSALGAFLERFSGPRAANLARRTEARVENGVAEDAVGLTAIDGVGPGRASKLAQEGIATPGGAVDAGVSGLAAAGLSEGVAERVHEGAQSLPAVEIEWGAFPETIAPGENDVCEVTVTNVGEPARAGVRVTVNGVEMTATETYLRESETVPVGVFGADEDVLEFTVSVAFPEEPLVPVEERRTVRVE